MLFFERQKMVRGVREQTSRRSRPSGWAPKSDSSEPQICDKFGFLCFPGLFAQCTRRMQGCLGACAVLLLLSLRPRRERLRATYRETLRCEEQAGGTLLQL